MFLIFFGNIQKHNLLTRTIHRIGVIILVLIFFTQDGVYPMACLSQLIQIRIDDPIQIRIEKSKISCVFCQLYMWVTVCEFFGSVCCLLKCPVMFVSKMIATRISVYHK